MCIRDRCRSITVTEKGRLLEREVTESMRAVEAQVTEGFTPQEREDVYKRQVFYQVKARNSGLLVLCKHFYKESEAF